MRLRNGGNLMSNAKESFGARATIETSSGPAVIYRLDSLEKSGQGAVSRLPLSIKVLLEALLRNCDGTLVTEEDVITLAQWNAQSPAAREVPFKPARVILQDFTGVPAVVNLAAMRSALKPGVDVPSRGATGKSKAASSRRSPSCCTQKFHEGNC
jgi:aconitase A